MNSPPFRRRNGFSLIEVIVVLIVLAILALVIVPQISSRAIQGREANLSAQLHEMRTAIQAYRADTGVAPANLRELIANNASVNNWNGPYLYREFPQDPMSAPNTGDNGNWNYDATNGRVASASTGYTGW